MSEDNNSYSEDDKKSEERAAKPISSTGKNVRLDVANRLASSGSEVRKNVVDLLYKAELDRRTEATLKVVTKLEELEKELSKLSRGDVQHYDASGKALVPAFTKERIDEINKKKEQITKHEKALSLALENGDFSRVNELGR